MRNVTTDQLSVGIIGTGLWGEQHAHVFATLPQTRLAAVCDLDRDRAAALAAQHGVADAYADHRELLARSDIDAVSIATPDFTHTQLILDALAAGQCVVARTAEHNVDEAVTDHRIVALFTEHRAVAGVAEHHVDARTTVQNVVVGAATQDVVVFVAEQPVVVRAAIKLV